MTFKEQCEKVFANYMGDLAIANEKTNSDSVILTKGVINAMATGARMMNDHIKQTNYNPAIIDKTVVLMNVDEDNENYDAIRIGINDIYNALIVDIAPITATEFRDVEWAEILEDTSNLMKNRKPIKSSLYAKIKIRLNRLANSF
jgi:hypothetical protein